jgi:hypothetical protein
MPKGKGKEKGIERWRRNRPQLSIPRGGEFAATSNGGTCDSPPQYWLSRLFAGPHPV